MSIFGNSYESGSIPCRIIHGNAKLNLKWDRDPQSLNYDPLLLNCFEGLLETEHPYKFTSRAIIKNLLDVNIVRGAYEKTKPLLPKIILSLRNSLASTSDFNDDLVILQLLSELVKEELNIYLHLILQPINKETMQKKHKIKINETLRMLEHNGGEEALKVIKKKIPTYIGMF